MQSIEVFQKQLRLHYGLQYAAFCKRNIIYNRPDFHKNARDRRIWYYFAVWSMAKYPDHFATLNLSNQIFNNGMVKYEKDQDGYTTAMLGLSNFATVLVFMLYLIFHTSLDRIFELPMSAIIMMFIGFFFSAATSLWTVHQRYKFKYKLLCLVTLIISLGSALLGVLFVRLESVGLARIWGDTITITTVGLLIYVLIVKKTISYSI